MRLNMNKQQVCFLSYNAQDYSGIQNLTGKMCCVNVV